MNESLNGTTPLHQPPAKGLPGRVIVDQCKGLLVVMARGMFSLLATLQYEGVVICLAQAAGEMLAEACWCNDVMHTISLRKKIRDAFDHGMKGVPSIAPAQPGEMPGTTKPAVRQ
jgi:hypothetical protein